METCVLICLLSFVTTDFSKYVASIKKAFSMMVFRKTLLYKKDILVDLEFLFMASWSAVETHSVHRNVGHLFWRNLHLQEAAAERKNRWEQKRGKKGGIYSVTIQLNDANAGGLHTNGCKRLSPQIPQTQISCQKHEKHTWATHLRQKHTKAKPQQPL